MDMKGGRAQREEGQEGRKDMKVGRTQRRREGGHEERKCDRPVPPLSSASGYFPSHMSLHMSGLEKISHIMVHH